MSDEQPRENIPETPQEHIPENPAPPPQRPTLLIPRSYVIMTAAIVALSIFVTLFMRNPYTQATSGDYYEKSSLDSSIIWAVIFIGLPGLWFAYQKWVAPRLRKRR
jgi:hypothetical protein